MKHRIKFQVWLYLSFLIYSFASVLAKQAGAYPLLSLPSLWLYGAFMAVLGVYALLWQQVLKRMPLTVAYAHKAVVIPLGMVWGLLFFSETIKWNMVAGTAIIVCGVLLLTGGE